MFHAAGIAGQLSFRAHAAVAGDDDADRVSAHRLSNRLGGHGFLSQNGSRLLRQISVGSGFPKGNGQQKLPDQFLKGCARQLYRNIHRQVFTTEVGIQPPGRFVEYRQRILLFRLGAAIVEAGQMLAVAAKQDRTRRGMVGCEKLQKNPSLDGCVNYTTEFYKSLSKSYLESS